MGNFASICCGPKKVKYEDFIKTIEAKDPMTEEQKKKVEEKYNNDAKMTEIRA